MAKSASWKDRFRQKREKKKNKRYGMRLMFPVPHKLEGVQHPVQAAILGCGVLGKLLLVEGHVPAHGG